MFFVFICQVGEEEAAVERRMQEGDEDAKKFRKTLKNKFIFQKIRGLFRKMLYCCDLIKYIITSDLNAFIFSITFPTGVFFNGAGLPPGLPPLFLVSSSSTIALASCKSLSSMSSTNAQHKETKPPRPRLWKNMCSEVFAAIAN